MIASLKPYPAMKDSGVEWLGEIPEHWEVSPGRSCFYEKKESNVGMVEKTVLSLSYGRIVVKLEKNLRGLVPESFETYQVVDPGDIICLPTDLQNDHTSLRFGISNDRGIITSAYMCFGTQDLLDHRFGYLLLHAYDLKKVFYGLGSGLRQNLSWEDFKYLTFVLPSLPEQAAIVRYLDYVDRRVRRLVRAKQKLIKLLEEQKQAIISGLVTGKFEVRKVKGEDGKEHLHLTPRPSHLMKPSSVEWLSDVPEHWEVWQIGHFSHVGNESTPSRGNSTYWIGGDYPWLNSAYANQEEITEADQFVASTALRECHLPVVPARSVLVAITGQGKTRGKAAVLLIEATINQHLAFITPRPDIASPDYLRLALHGAYTQLRSISEDSGSTKGALTCAALSHFRLAIPPIDEQVMILKAVGDDTKISSAAIGRTRREIELLREYRTRLIADVVTGKLDVREAAARLPEELDESDLMDDIEEQDKDKEETDGADMTMTPEKAHHAD